MDCVFVLLINYLDAVEEVLLFYVSNYHSCACFQ